MVVRGVFSRALTRHTTSIVYNISVRWSPQSRSTRHYDICQPTSFSRLFHLTGPRLSPCPLHGLVSVSGHVFPVQGSCPLFLRCSCWCSVSASSCLVFGRWWGSAWIRVWSKPGSILSLEDLVWSNVSIMDARDQNRTNNQPKDEQPTHDGHGQNGTFGGASYSKGL